MAFIELFFVLILPYKVLYVCVFVHVWKVSWFCEKVHNLANCGGCAAILRITAVMRKRSRADFVIIFERVALNYTNLLLSLYEIIT